MPPVIFAAGAAALSGVIAGATTTAIIASAVIAGAASGLNLLLAGKPSTPDAAPAFTIEAQERSGIIRSAISPRRLGYGEIVTSGALEFYEETDAGGGLKYAHAVIALLDHQIDAMLDVWIDGAQVGPRDGTGTVTSGAFANLVRIKTHLGRDDQAADADLVAETTANDSDRWQGVAYIYVRLKEDATAFPLGFPQSIRVRMRAKLLYDPRDAGVAITSSTAAAPAVFTTAAAHGLAAGERVWIKDHAGAVLARHDPRRAGVAKEYQVKSAPSPTTFTLVAWDGEPLALSAAGGGGAVTKMRWSPNWALAVRDFIAGDWGIWADDDELSAAHDAAAANLSDEDVGLSGNEVDIFTADAASDSFTHSDPVSSRLQTGDRVRVETTGTLPSGLAAATDYYYIRGDGTPGSGDLKFRLATSRANAFAETALAIADAGTGVHSVIRSGQARYEAHGIIEATSKPIDVLEDLLTAGYGVVDYTQGLHRLHGGGWTLPSAALDERDVRGTLIDDPRIQRGDLYNAVKASYVEPFKNYRVTEIAARTNAAYELEDGGRQIVREVQLAFIQDHIRAQRICEMIKRDSRFQTRLSVPTFLKRAVRLTAWDTAVVSIPDQDFYGDPFRVIGYDRDLPGMPTLHVKATHSTIYDWSPEDEAGFSDVTEFDIEIGAGDDLDLKQHLIDNTAWNGSQPGVTFNITFTGARTSTSTSVPAIDIAALPIGTILNIAQNAEAAGKGGAGGASPGLVGSPGSPGGPAVKVAAQPTGVQINWTNNSEINGGGGGGGGGGDVEVVGPPPSCAGNRVFGGGSGGAGYGPGAAGSGTAGASINDGCAVGAGGAGGNGGGKGAAGAAGAAGSASVGQLTSYAGGAGGAAGAAVDGDSRVTWLVEGTINGPRIN